MLAKFHIAYQLLIFMKALKRCMLSKFLSLEMTTPRPPTPEEHHSPCISQVCGRVPSKLSALMYEQVYF